MSQGRKIYILGCGAIGLALAAFLAKAGRQVIAVRTSREDVFLKRMPITVHNGADAVLNIEVETVSLAKLTELDGIAVVTAKSYANRTLARMLAAKAFQGPLFIMQNGIGVEGTFIEHSFKQVFRCVLYTTGQRISENGITFRPVASSPIGVIKGLESDLKEYLSVLTTEEFPFHYEKNIPRDIWKKAIINSVFNSICPLLEVDNGIFRRDKAVAKLAGEIVSECLILAGRKGISLTEPELMDQIMRISQGSEGISISTLQDIRNGKETEIESLNLELARIASLIDPPVSLIKTELLGKMILAKSSCQR